MGNVNTTIKELLKYSENTEKWEDEDGATMEWVNLYPRWVEFEEGHQCICGTRITEMCYVFNIKTGSIRVIGNECVKALGNPLMEGFEYYFKEIRGYKITATKIDWAMENRYISEWTYIFMTAMMGIPKKEMTTKQLGHFEIESDRIKYALEWNRKTTHL